MNAFESSLQEIRKEYESNRLSEEEVAVSPIEQLKNWLNEALSSELLEPTAMHLATVSAAGRISGRIVLLKGIDKGLVFYSNYQSRKGKEIEAGKLVAATLFWDRLERQVRIEGTVEKLSESESESYFHSRPYKSQLGALVSPQSTVIPSRAVLEEEMVRAMQQYPEGSKVPKPLHWGGYRILPDYFEFWQGRRSRLHDRITYSADEASNWKIERLAP